MSFSNFQQHKVQVVSLMVMCSISLSLSSCTTLPKTTQSSSTPKTSLHKGSRMIHTVAPGETFWRISQMYDVPMAAIMTANKTIDPKSLKMGQKLFIPNASTIKPIITLFPSSKWKYIIIHHSGTEEGSSLAFHRSHLSRGWDNGVGYNFVIDNETSGKHDGQIEVTPRWLKQLDGAHTKASNMNAKAIGIVLVGNFDNEFVSKKQINSLVFLVNKLRRYYKIPLKNILRHQDVRSASTRCPGVHFPWKGFKYRLRKNM